MKKVIYGIFLLVLIIFTCASAGEVTLAWDAPEKHKIIKIAGYRIHYGKKKRDYNVNQDVGMPNPLVATITGLVDGETYRFAATAYSEPQPGCNNIHESGYSNEVIYTIGEPIDRVKPEKVTNVRKMNVIDQGEEK